MAGPLLLLYWHRRIISSMGCIHLGWTERRCYLFPEAARIHVAKCLKHKVPLHNQSVRFPVTRTWLLELGPDCLQRSYFDAQMPEGPKGYSWNAPKILQVWGFFLFVLFFIMSGLLSESFYPFQSVKSPTEPLQSLKDWYLENVFHPLKITLPSGLATTASMSIQPHSINSLCFYRCTLRIWILE